MRDARRLDFAPLTGIDSLTYKLRSFDDGRRVLVIFNFVAQVQAYSK
jgi:hypothetical protein